MSERVSIVGAGLAGSEAAWQLAQRGHEVLLIEQKPAARTPAQISDGLAELVCSNSLRSSNPQNAVGLLKEEMRRLGSLIITAAETTRVPAGDALAVNRELFSEEVTRRLHAHPRITVESRLVEQLPTDAHCIIATGPLTAPGLASAIAEATGSGHLFFYDSVAPIISADSIDRDIVFAASRYGKGDGDDYLNCPLERDEYTAFIDALLAAECVPAHDFEEPRYFEGCLPIEVIAARGHDSPRFGTMKPVGLTDPRTGRRPWAVVQLRKEDIDGQAYNLVGFQTKLKYPDQKRVFSMIPGLAKANFLRLGVMHRNTYLDSPSLLDEGMRLKSRPRVRFAGQITGVEGYVESAGHGLLTALFVSAELSGSPISAPPSHSALGALHSHVMGNHRLPGRGHEPQNVNWSMFPPTPPGTKKPDKKILRVRRAIPALDEWALQSKLSLTAPSFDAEALQPPPRKGKRGRGRSD